MILTIPLIVYNVSQSIGQAVKTINTRYTCAAAVCHCHQALPRRQFTFSPSPTIARSHSRALGPTQRKSHINRYSPDPDDNHLNQAPNPSRQYRIHFSIWCCTRSLDSLLLPPTANLALRQRSPTLARRSLTTGALSTTALPRSLWPGTRLRICESLQRLPSPHTHLQAILKIRLSLLPPPHFTLLPTTPATAHFTAAAAARTSPPTSTSSALPA